MKRKIITTGLTAFLALAAGFAGNIQAAQLGDTAPKLQIAEWIKGKAEDVTDGKNIYIVEFWATWCGPCRTSIPHLTEMQKKFQKKGVVFIGISDEKASVVKPFVDKMGEKMDYTIAVDRDKQTSAGYMEAFGIGGIPHAFVVDKQGKIVWEGHPMSDLENTVEQLIAGKYDMNKARMKAESLKMLQEFYELAGEDKDKDKIAELGKKLEARDKEAGGLMPGGQKFEADKVRKQARFSTLYQQYAQALLGEKDEEKADQIARQMGSVAPSGFKLQELKRDMLFRQDFSEYYKLVTKGSDKVKIAELAAKISAAKNDNVMLLNEFAWAILTDTNVKIRDFPLALKLAGAANEAAKGKDENILDTYALALFENGKVKEAIEQEKKALAMCKDPEKKPEFEKALKKFQEGKK